VAIESLKRIENPVQMEVVVVDFCFCAVSRVEVRRDGGDFPDADIGGEERIERGAEELFFKKFLAVEVGCLAKRMDARIGPARSGEIEGVAKGGPKGRLDEGLNGGLVFLHLPARIMGAVIGDEEFIAHRAIIQEMGEKNKAQKQVFLGRRKEEKNELREVFVDEFRHFKHVYGSFPAKNLLQLLIRVDIAAIFWVLQTVFLDVCPQFFCHFCAWHWSFANYRSKLFAAFHWLHKLRIFLLCCHVSFSF